jgi:hypothetical protein
LYIFFRIVLAPVIDEPLIGHAWLIGELDPVVLINFRDLLRIVALPSMSNSFADEIWNTVTTSPTLYWCAIALSRPTRQTDHTLLSNHIKSTFSPSAIDFFRPASPSMTKWASANDFICRNFWFGRSWVQANQFSLFSMRFLHEKPLNWKAVTYVSKFPLQSNSLMNS